MNQNTKIIRIIGAVVVLILASLPSAYGMINKTINVENVGRQAGFEAINIDETTIEITVNPGELEFDSINTEEGMFASLALPNYGFIFVKGEAKLPIIRKMIEIPQGSNPDLIINSISWEYTSLNELHLPSRIIPAQQSVEKIPETSDDFVLDEEYYSTNTFSPEVIIKIVEIGEIRSRCFALVEISPLQYRPVTGELKIMNSCKITINLPNSDMAKTYEKIQRYSSSSFENIFETAFENYGFYENGLGYRDQEGYLFIVYDNFYNEIQPLANLKTNKGYDTTIIKTSQIPGGPTRENILNYIEDAYDTWTIPPTFVLLVGDTPQIPTFTGSSSNSEADLYYVTVSGSDYFPDIHIGRFPASQKSHVEAMVDKTIYYEQGSFSSNEWIKKGAFIASSDQGQLAEQTHDYVINNFLDPNGYTCDKIYQASGGSTSDIHNALNDGRSLCIYSGHGSPGGWSCVPFGKSDVRSLVNNGMYPFVCSHACSTNTFGDSECFGETWLREADKAGLAFWGASASTYWDEDDILERAMFQAWWDDGLEWISGMTDMALFYLYQHYSGGGLTKYYFEAYNVNGDPSVKIWSDDPSLPPEIPTKPDGPEEWTIHIETTFTSTTTDPEGDSIYYLFNWGDGTDSGWLGPYSSGQTAEASHIWTKLGEYNVNVRARDKYGVQSDWSEPATISILENEPPEKPIISGPTSGDPRKLLKFTFKSIDPEGHDLYYMVSWGDGHYIPYTGPKASGEEVTFSHAWGNGGDFTIIVKVMDQFGAKGPQNQIKLRITKNRIIVNPVLPRVLENLMDRFPVLEWILLKIHL